MSAWTAIHFLRVFLWNRQLSAGEKSIECGDGWGASSDVGGRTLPSFRDLARLLFVSLFLTLRFWIPPRLHAGPRFIYTPHLTLRLSVSPASNAYLLGMQRPSHQPFCNRCDFERRFSNSDVKIESTASAVPRSFTCLAEHFPTRWAVYASQGGNGARNHPRKQV